MEVKFLAEFKEIKKTTHVTGDIVITVKFEFGERYNKGVLAELDKLHRPLVPVVISISDDEKDMKPWASEMKKEEKKE